MQVLKKETRLSISPKDGYKPTKSKKIRLQQVLPIFRNDRVRFLKGGWNRPLKDQLINFPFDEHDDRVDSLVWGLIYYQDYLDQHSEDLMKEMMKQKKIKDNLSNNKLVKTIRSKRRSGKSMSPDWRM